MRKGRREREGIGEREGGREETCRRGKEIGHRQEGERIGRYGEPEKRD